MMIEEDGRSGLGEETVTAFVGAPESETREMTTAERDQVINAGDEFAEQVPGIWLLISGRFSSSRTPEATEDQVRNQLRGAFNDPGHDSRIIKVLLDSSGGSLDSAYETVLYLSAYAKRLEVYVTDRAKSASTLLALGADKVYLSRFGELGPLDSQIRDPRNPVVWVSALDCYQCVDYVRDFGVKTVKEVLDRLIVATGRRVPVQDLLMTASSFSLGVIDPMMRGVPALDFGGWGRNLRISEHYARKLLQAKNRPADDDEIDTAHELVYGYPHHLFPIDVNEAQRIGISVAVMDEKLYEAAAKVVETCHGKDFVGFISKPEARKVSSSPFAPPVTGRPVRKSTKNGSASDEEHHGETGLTMNA